MNLNRLKTLLETCVNFDESTYTMLKHACSNMGISEYSMRTILRHALRMGLVEMRSDGQGVFYVVTPLGTGVLKHLNNGVENNDLTVLKRLQLNDKIRFSLKRTFEKQRLSLNGYRSIPHTDGRDE
jgi:hypothetical protein